MEELFDIVYIVSYEGIDGKTYKTVVKERTEYDARSKVASFVNSNQNFGMNFRAEVHPTI